jgi:hypothetical protein
MDEKYFGYDFSHNIRMVCLWWYSTPLASAQDLATAKNLTGDEKSDAGKALTSPGVYAFEGKHDARPEGGLLYIGRAGSNFTDTDGTKPPRPLHERIFESANHFIWRRGRDSGLYADVWDVKIRFATVAPEIISRVEGLLIRGHAPSFNTQQVRGRVIDNDLHNVIVINAGEKGRLLPAVAGAYYHQALWDSLKVHGPR